MAGCSTASRQSTQTSASPVPDGSDASSADEADYSPEAVAHRTEVQARFATGFLYDLDDKAPQAAEEYLKAGLADPTNEPLVLEITTRLLRFKETGKALELLQKATAQPDASGMLFAQLGLICSLSDKKEAAIQANQTAIQKSPELLAGYRHLAQIYLQDGQPEKGLEVLDQAARQPEASALFLTELGEFYLAFNRVGTNDAARTRAKQVFERAAEQQPTHPLVLQKLADGLNFVGEIAKAAELYRKLLEQLPQLPGIRVKLADLYLRNKDYSQAAEQLEAIVKSDPTNLQANYMLGSIAYEAKDMPRAEECFRKVKLLNPDFEPAYYDLAGALINLNQPTNALTVLDQAREKFKPSFVCEFYSAMAYSRQKHYNESLKHLVAAEVVARATDTNRLNQVFYFQLGATYERNQQFDEAVKSFRKCLEMAPDFSEALNYLGYMWAERGENLNEAREMIAKAVKLDSKNAAYLDSMGWVLYRLNQPKDALPFLLKAVEYADEPDPTLHDHLGDVYLALKQTTKARTAWQKALTIEPNEHKEAIQKKLNALKSGAETSSNSPSN